MNRPAPCSQVSVTLPTTADTMDDVWDSLCAQVILHDADFHAVDRRIAALDRKRELQKQADKLRKAIIRTNQTARRNGETSCGMSSEQWKTSCDIRNAQHPNPTLVCNTTKSRWQ